MHRFKSSAQAQRFHSGHSMIYGHFAPATSQRNVGLDVMADARFAVDRQNGAAHVDLALRYVEVGLGRGGEMRQR